jgi:hypothetical protein
VSRRGWIYVFGGIAALVVVGLAVGLTLGLSGGKKSTMSHAGYARLWTSTSVGSQQAAVLKRWPKPYNVYHDGFSNQCYEWSDYPAYLYNLCFKKGILITKSLA